MNEKIRTHVKSYNEANDFGTSENSIISTIREGEEVWTGNFYSRRHWDDCFTVVTINGMLIGFDNARTTGDEPAEYKGWEFDPKSICEVEENIVKTITYKKKN